jgi:hypothetical protein
MGFGVQLGVAVLAIPAPSSTFCDRAVTAEAAPRVENGRYAIERVVLESIAVRSDSETLGKGSRDGNG